MPEDGEGVPLTYTEAVHALEKAIEAGGAGHLELDLKGLSPQEVLLLTQRFHNATCPIARDLEDGAKIRALEGPIYHNRTRHSPLKSHFVERESVLSSNLSKCITPDLGFQLLALKQHLGVDNFSAFTSN